MSSICAFLCLLKESLRRESVVPQDFHVLTPVGHRYVVIFAPLQVKSAEAEAEAKYLSGVGVAKQRGAIVDGLRSSIVDFTQNVNGASTKEVMDLLLLTQYFDMIRDVGSASHCRTTFVPTSRTMGDSMRNSLLQAKAATD